MLRVYDDLQKLYADHDVHTGQDYNTLMAEALGPGLAYATPAMFGVTATVLSSRRMIAYNLVQNSIDEAKGAARIQVIADRYAADTPLERKMKRHVGEELKHSRQFKDLVTTTGYGTVDEAVDQDAADEVLDFDDELKAFICRVHSIEIRSWSVLRMYQQVLGENEFPQLTEAALPVLDDIMQDEMFHVRYTGQQIDEWLREDPSLATTLLECMSHTNRETWQDIAAMTSWLAQHFPRLLADESGDVALPDTRFLVGDLNPPATLT
ncbi:MAG TPA: hypothetical protein VFB84_18115 [Micromonosporaceae bacterium]|nr:hypothetical protein [Micromonosporaceae bacterium]